MKRGFGEVLGRERTEYLKFGTVDGFQGHEMDVIIMSCVRANPERSIGALPNTTP